MPEETKVVRPIESVGVSPKVKLPPVVQGLLGAGLFIVGLLIEEPTLQEIGGALFLASPLLGLIGFGAKPGEVVVSK